MSRVHRLYLQAFTASACGQTPSSAASTHEEDVAIAQGVLDGLRAKQEPGIYEVKSAKRLNSIIADIIATQEKQ